MSHTNEVFSSYMEQIEAENQAKIDKAYNLFMSASEDTQANCLKDIGYEGEVTEEKLRTHFDDVELMFDALDAVIARLTKAIQAESTTSVKH